LPQSRKRKTRRGGVSSRSTYSSQKKSNKTNIIIICAIIAAFVIGAAALLFSGKGSENGGKVGEEVTTPSGLKYIDEAIGTGESPARGKTVTVHYTGMLEDGYKFDSSVDKGQPYTFRYGIDPFIDGWNEGLLTMKPGGKRRLIIPPNLGYGARGNAPAKIPPNATLIFELELLSVK
jgi:FKBP-type peptidyl-prolyl cis-trans isomerase